MQLQISSSTNNHVTNTTHICRLAYFERYINIAKHTHQIERMQVSEADLSDFLLRILFFIKRKHGLRSAYILNNELLRGGTTLSECITRNCCNMYIVPSMRVLINGLIRHNICHIASPISSWSPTAHLFASLQEQVHAARGSDVAVVIIDALILYSVLQLTSSSGLRKCAYNDARRAVAAQTAALILSLFEQTQRLGHLIFTSPPNECIAHAFTPHSENATYMDTVNLSEGPVICYDTLKKQLTCQKCIYSTKCRKTAVGPLHKAAYAICIKREII